MSSIAFAEYGKVRYNQISNSFAKVIAKANVNL